VTRLPTGVQVRRSPFALRSRAWPLLETMSYPGEDVATASANGSSMQDPPVRLPRGTGGGLGVHSHISGVNTGGSTTTRCCRALTYALFPCVRVTGPLRVLAGRKHGMKSGAHAEEAAVSACWNCGRSHWGRALLLPGVQGETAQRGGTNTLPRSDRLAEEMSFAAHPSSLWSARCPSSYPLKGPGNWDGPPSSCQSASDFLAKSLTQKTLLPRSLRVVGPNLSWRGADEKA